MRRPLPDMPRRGRRGLSLIDLLLTVSIIGIAVLVAASASSPAERTRLVAAAHLLLSDVEFAREMSISDPSDYTVLRIASDNKGYWIARASNTEIPVTKADGKPYSVTFGQNEQSLLVGVTVTLAKGGSALPAKGMIGFDSFGRLTTSADVELAITNTSGTITVAVTAITGDASLK